MLAVRIAEEHLDLFGPIGRSLFKQTHALEKLPKSRVGIDRRRILGPLNTIETRGDIQQFAANFEINAVENHVGRL